MTEDNTPIAEDSNESSNAADSFFAPETTTQANTSSRKKWIMPGAALASAALLSGLIGFSIGNHSGPDFRPAAAMGQMAPGQGGPGQGGPGQGGLGHDGQSMNGDHGRGMGGDHKGKGHHQGQGQPGIMPGAPQGGTDLPPTTPHCHDATGADVEVGADGLCADGSQPGMRGKGGMTATPTPSASSSTSIQ